MSKKEIAVWLAAIAAALIGLYIAREHPLISIVCFAPLPYLTWSKYKQYKKEKILKRLEKLEWRDVSTFESNWCGCLKISTEAKEEGWEMLSAEELVVAMGRYLSKFSKRNYWSSEGLTVSFPEKKILKENPVRNAGLCLVRVKRGR